MRLRSRAASTPRLEVVPSPNSRVTDPSKGGWEVIALRQLMETLRRNPEALCSPSPRDEIAEGVG
jgi:hypothetical protein